MTLMDWVIALMFVAGIYLLYLERALIYKGFLSYKWPRMKAVIKDQRDDSFDITGFSYARFRDVAVRFKEIAYIYE